MSEASWFFTKDGKAKIGPMSYERLKQLVKNGVIDKKTMVYSPDVTQSWITADQVNGLFPSSWKDIPKWIWFTTVPMSFFMLCCGGCTFLAMFGHAVNVSTNREVVFHTSEQPSQTETAIQVAATQLIQEYKSNEVAADNKYKDKIIQVTGVVQSVKKGIISDTYVILKGTGLWSVQCYFDDENQLATLTSGQSVTIKGRCDGKFGNVHLKECQLVK